MSELDDKIAACEAELKKAKDVLEAKPTSEYFADRKEELESDLAKLKKQKKRELAATAPS